MRAALMTVPSTGAPDRKRCRLSETDLSNALSLFAKQQRQKEKKITGGAAGRVQVIYIYSLATTGGPVYVCNSRNASRSGTPSTRAREDTQNHARGRNKGKY